LIFERKHGIYLSTSAYTKMQKLLFPNPSQNIDCKIFPMMVAHKGTLSKLRSGGAFVQSLLTLGSQIS
jgi:hypothetical protein